MTLLSNYWQVVRGFSRDIWIFLASWAFLAFGYFGIMGVLLNLYLLRLGYGPKFIGLLIGSGQLLWALLALPAASVGLRIGPRNAMSIGYGLIAAGSALIVLVQIAPPAIWPYWLVGSWMILWAGASMATVNGVPYLMALTSPDERYYAFAIQSSALALFAFVGSVAAGFLPALLANWFALSLEDAAPYRLALWAAPLLFLLSATTILQAPSITLPRPDRLAGAAIQRPVKILLFVALTFFLMTAIEGAVRSFFNVYLDTRLNMSTTRIGVIMGVGQLLPAAAALTAPLLMAWLGAGRTFSLAALAAGLFMLPLALIQHWTAAALSFVGVIGANATSVPARNVFGQICVEPQWRSSSSASSTIGVGLGWATMAVLGGFIIDLWGFEALFLLGAALGFANALLLTLYLHRGRYPAASTMPAE